jgi:hypothetical protein
VSTCSWEMFMGESSKRLCSLVISKAGRSEPTCILADGHVVRSGLPASVRARDDDRESRGVRWRGVVPGVECARWPISPVRTPIGVRVASSLTFNGYNVWGSFETCAEIANAQRHDSLTNLRTCLFFE